MKKFTKIIVAVLAIAMLSVSFAGCGLVEDTEKVEKVKIQKETMLTIGDDITVSGAYYGWYFANAYDDAYQSAQFIQQFESVEGDSAVSSSAEPVIDSAADSAAEPATGSSAESAPAEIKVDMAIVKKQAIDEITAVKMACQKAKEAGIELTNEDYVYINSSVDAYKNEVLSSFKQSGYDISFADYLLQVNTNIDAVNQVFEDKYLANLYYANLVADEYVTVKHILVMYGEGMLTKEEAEAKAADIKAQLDAGADFEQLMSENSDDSVDETGKHRAYTFAKNGSMVAPFEEAAFALKEGEISDLVNYEGDYSGYHIIKKYPVNNNDVAKNITTTDKLTAEKEKLIKDVKVKEGNKISYYSKAYNN